MIHEDGLAYALPQKSIIHVVFILLPPQKEGVSSLEEDSLELWLCLETALRFLSCLTIDSHLVDTAAAGAYVCTDSNYACSMVDLCGMCQNKKSITHKMQMQLIFLLHIMTGYYSFMFYA